MDNNNNQPPKWMDKLLSMYCSAHRFEELKGDLLELYTYDVQEKGSKRANRAYLWNILKCMKPYAYRPDKPFHRQRNNTMDMILNHITIAFRKLYRQWSYSLLNISGLTLGIVCFTFIYLFVNHELSFDKFHTKKENLYTTPFTWHFGTTTLPTARATSNVGPLLYEFYPEVKQFVRLTPMSKVIRNDATVAEESSFIYTDSTFFDMFSFELLIGSEKSALTKPKSVVLTEKMASKYYGNTWDESIVGSTLQIGSEEEYLITGIAKNPPDNSHIQFDFLASISTFPGVNNLNNFDNSAFLTYIELAPNTDIDRLQTQIAEDIRERFNGELPVEIGLKPFDEVYLEYGMDTGVGPMGNISTVYIFAGIGLLIILIACINYMNMATARSVDRAKEVGVRKAMGAAKKQLVWQFLGESFIITLISILLSVGLLYTFLPLFNNLSNKELSIHLFDSHLGLFLLGIWVIVSVVAGLYPAFVLSGFSIIGVLRGKFKNSSTGSRLRRVLVILQFSISVILIVCTLVIYKQLNFVENKELGYDKELIISLPLDPQSQPKIDYLKQQFESLSEIQSTSVTSQLPSRITHETTIAKQEGEENRQLLRNGYIDNDYIQTLGLEVMAGGKMSLTNDSIYEYILNESAASFFGWTPEEAIGQRLKIWNSEWGNVVGVVKDFHFSSLHEKIKPLLLYNIEDNTQAFGLNQLMLRVTSNDLISTLSSIEEIWVKSIDHKPFEYSFLVDRLDNSYKKESLLGELITIFALLAIFIGCLGLFGLVSYTAFQRSKEIGIRKVLGASVSNIILILSKGFSKQILIALVIGISAAYLIMNEWLQGFEYKTNIGLDTIFWASALTIGIAFFTMSFKSVQAALVNPADTLNSE